MYTSDRSTRFSTLPPAPSTSPGWAMRYCTRASRGEVSWLSVMSASMRVTVALAAMMVERVPTSCARAASMAACAAATCAFDAATAACALRTRARSSSSSWMDEAPHATACSSEPGGAAPHRARSRAVRPRPVPQPCRFAHGHLRRGAGGGIDGLLLLRACFVALRLQHLDLHACQGCTGGNEVAFVDENGVDASGELGRHVNLRGFDTAVAACEARPGTGLAHGVPAIHACRDGQRHGGGGNQLSGREFHDGLPEDGGGAGTTAESSTCTWVPPPSAV